MAKFLLNENDVKKHLAIDNFRNIPKNKIIEFVSAIPYMNTDVAIKIIEQFPLYAELAINMITELNIMCNNAMEKNEASQKEVILAYKKILDDLGELLKKETITPEERAYITEKMIVVADRIAETDAENKKFLNGIVKYAVPAAGGVLILAATILGVNVKSIKIPTLSS